MNMSILIPSQNEGLLPVLFGSNNMKKEEPTYTPCEVVNEPTKKERRKHFIEANTTPIDIQHLKNDCIVPVFSKDNEMTISHPAFIETVHKVASELFRGERMQPNHFLVVRKWNRQI